MGPKATCPDRYTILESEWSMQVLPYINRLCAQNSRGRRSLAKSEHAPLAYRSVVIHPQ